MGVIFSSCCPSSSGQDEESLLRSQQEGYGSMSNGGSNQYEAAQEQMREYERRLQARDQELRGIVATTNDKLIDISMISNSGIVVQKNDLYTEDLDEDTTPTDSLPQGEQGSMQQQQNNTGETTTPAEQATHGENSLHFTVLTEEKVTEEMRQQLQQLHDRIMDQLNRQLDVGSPQDLTLTF